MCPLHKWGDEPQSHGCGASGGFAQNSLQTSNTPFPLFKGANETDLCALPAFMYEGPALRRSADSERFPPRGTVPPQTKKYAIFAVASPLSAKARNFEAKV